MNENLRKLYVVFTALSENHFNDKTIHLSSHLLGQEISVTDSKSRRSSSDMGRCFRLFFTSISVSIRLNLVDLFQHLFDKFLLIFWHKPFINRDIVVLIHLCSDNFLPQGVWTGRFLDVSAKMSETMKFNNYIFEVLPLRYHDVTYQIVQVVFRKAWNPKRNKCVSYLYLSFWWMSFKLKIRH